MKLTCVQMDVLITFYIDGELSSTLKKQVEDHLKTCTTCRAKYDIIKSMLVDLKKSLDLGSESGVKEVDSTYPSSKQYRLFKNDLSAYIDNELSNDENIKIKKFTINNSQARQELEENYNIRKLLSDSFNKTKSDVRQDFSRSVLRQLELDDDSNLGIHPAIKILIVFTVVVLMLSSIVLMSLSV